MDDPTGASLLDLTTDVVAAYLANNKIAAEQVPDLIARVHASLADLGRPSAAQEPAPIKLTDRRIRRSIKPDALISFEDGKPYKALKRHLSVRGMTIDDYRQKWGLPSDYPSVAATYSEQRSAMARSLGLGRKPGPTEKPVARKARG